VERFTGKPLAQCCDLLGHIDVDHLKPDPPLGLVGQSMQTSRRTGAPHRSDDAPPVL
jgi:hypothetical protein